MATFLDTGIGVSLVVVVAANVVVVVAAVASAIAIGNWQLAKCWPRLCNCLSQRLQLEVTFAAKGAAGIDCPAPHYTLLSLSSLFRSLSLSLLAWLFLAKVLWG